MTDQMPDRLSVNPSSPYYDEQLLLRGVGIRFNGEVKSNVEEYCISEGWIKVAAGKAVDRKGNPLTLKLKGTVEAYTIAAVLILGIFVSTFIISYHSDASEALLIMFLLEEEFYKRGDKKLKAASAFN